LQIIAAKVSSIDAIWYTHYHADHTHGVDDVRAFSVRRSEPLVVYGSRTCVESLATKFDYVFDPMMKPIPGTTKPEADLQVVEPYEPVEVAGFEMLPLPVPHGDLDAFGFRVGDLGYITDAKRLPERTRDALKGVKTLVLNALWFGKPHPTHFTVEEAVNEAQRIGADRTFLTHLSHHTAHAELEARLPAGILPAYDGLEIEF